MEEETDRGPAEANKDLARFCIATGEAKPSGEMIRYVVAPNGSIVPDVLHKLPGRGAWVSASRAALLIAIERKSFARAFRGKGVAGAELPELVERLLQRSALDAISMANKAGQVVSGFGQVKAALARGGIEILVHASDAGADGIQKLDHVKAAGNGEKPAIIRLFSGEQLDLALGRPNVVHAALFGHPASRVFLAHSLRYERWREEEPAGKGMNIDRDVERSAKKGH
jgi:predicted RNA-binding protein YlxR (DUF448 family)